jgi:hypothetical protein
MIAHPCVGCLTLFQRQSHALAIPVLSWLPSSSPTGFPMAVLTPACQFAKNSSLCYNRLAYEDCRNWLFASEEPPAWQDLPSNHFTDANPGAVCIRRLCSGMGACPHESIRGWQTLADGQRAHSWRLCKALCVTLLSLFTADLTFQGNCVIIVMPVGPMLSSSRATI